MICKQSCKTFKIIQFEAFLPSNPSGLEAIFPLNVNLSECNSKMSAMKVHNTFHNIFPDFLSRLSESGCPLPCTHKGFSHEFKEFNKNSWIDMEDGIGPGNILHLKNWLDFDWNALLLVKPLHKKWRHNTITEKDDFI